MEDLIELLDLNAKIKNNKIIMQNNLRHKSILNDYNRL